MMDFTNAKFDRNTINMLDIGKDEKNTLLKMLHERDAQKMEEIAKMMWGEEERFFSASGENSEKLSLYDSLKCEVYKFFCTNDENYEKERGGIADNLEKLILILATAIAATLGVAVAIVTGIIAAILMVMIKVGKNAWCNTNKNVCN